MCLCFFSSMSLEPGASNGGEIKLGRREVIRGQTRKGTFKPG